MGAGQWWYTPLIPALGRQRHVDLCEFETNLVYRVSSMTVRAVTQKNPILKNNKTNKQIKILEMVAANSRVQVSVIDGFSRSLLNFL